MKDESTNDFATIVVKEHDELWLKVRACLDFRTISANVKEAHSIEMSPETLTDAYFNDKRIRSVPPNPVFDELFYRRRYPDVSKAIDDGTFPSGLAHFILCGFEEERFPNQAIEVLANESLEPVPTIDSSAVAVDALKTNPLCRDFARWFRIFPSLDIYNRLGRKLIREVSSANFVELARPLFDAKHYLSQLNEAEWPAAGDAFRHYLDLGAAQGLSPSTAFDERFYLAFYDDVRFAKSVGAVICGFHHYLMAGRQEGRLATFATDDALEARYHGITRKTAVERLEALTKKLAVNHGHVGHYHGRRLTVVVPDLNPDIFFGGYRSLIELVAVLRERDLPLRIIKSESAYDGKDYFMYHYAGSRIGDAFRDIPTLGSVSDIDVGSGDRFLCYSTWDSYVGRNLAAHTGHRRILLLAQEYEPIFHSMNALHFLSNAAYQFDHFPIFNSQLLVEYFKKERIGIFRNDASNSSYAMFEHVLAEPLRRARRLGEQKSFFVYARPETHAERNLFEITVLALRQALEIYQPKGDWTFFGLGSLGKPIDIDLDGRHALQIRSKLPYSEYAERMSTISAGLSLMYAPHPSVVPFELAQNGAFVVTNTFSNRSKHALSQISSNIIPVDLSLEEVAGGIAEALRRVDDGVIGEMPDFRQRPKTWKDAFHPVLARLEEEGFI